MRLVTRDRRSREYYWTVDRDRPSSSSKPQREFLSRSGGCLPAVWRLCRGGGPGAWTQRGFVASVGWASRAQWKAYCDKDPDAEHSRRERERFCAAAVVVQSGLKRDPHRG
jgi:hypothetical protein